MIVVVVVVVVELNIFSDSDSDNDTANRRSIFSRPSYPSCYPVKNLLCGLGVLVVNSIFPNSLSFTIRRALRGSFVFLELL